LAGVSPSEIWDRAQLGPRVDLKEYNFKILCELTGKLVKEHDIKIDRDSIVPVDNSLADSIYQAGYELLLENGVYCTDTGRMIKVTNSEIRDGIRSAPTQITVGEGRDAVNILQRKVGETRSPVVLCGCEAIPVSEEIFVKAMQSYAQEPYVDIITPGTLAAVEGHQVAAHSPYELKAALLEGRMSRMACALAGRPGMGLGCPPVTVTTPEARIAAEEELRPSDLHQISIMSELKISLGSVTVLACWLRKGNLLYPEAMPIFGGYVGGSVERMAVLDVAAHLASFTLLSASIHDDGPVHVTWGCTTARETIQVAAHTGLAMDRNTNLLTATMYYPRAGPSTEMISVESAAQLIADVASGREMVEGIGANRGVAQDHVDGLLGRVMGKISAAATRLNLGQANEIAKMLLAKYDSKEYYKTAPAGKRFQETYDVMAVKPTEEHLKVYEASMKKLEEVTGLRLF
jgi:methylamine--corrinoid protein Co-methyltransferase